MWFMHLARKISILFMLLAVCGFSKTLHILNPWDDVSQSNSSHPRIQAINSQGDTAIYLPVVDQVNCGWYTWQYTDEQLSIIIKNSTDEYFGTPGSSGARIDLDTLGDGAFPTTNELWLHYNSGSHTISNAKVGGDGTCIGVVSAQVYDWKYHEFAQSGSDNGDFEGQPSSTTVCGSGDGTAEPGMVESTLVNGVPKRLSNRCESDSLDQWFIPKLSAATKCIDLALEKKNGSYERIDNSFFPLDDFQSPNNNLLTDPGRLYTDLWHGNPAELEHNYYFCMQFEADFTYLKGSGQTFTFAGDDDVWVFIDNKLEIDLGGYHTSVSDDVNLDVVLAAALDSTKHTFNFFFCERKYDSSKLQITTNIDFEQGAPYRNEPVAGSPNTWEVVDGVEYSQGCGGNVNTITRESEFYIAKDSPSLSNVLTTGGGPLADGVHFSGITIDGANNRFSIDSDVIKGSTLAPGDYYLLHQTNENGRTDMGYVYFKVYPQVNFDLSGSSQALEDADAGVVQIPFTLNFNALEDLQINFSITSGTADATDYSPLASSIVTIPAGSNEGFVTLQVTTDNVPEPNETVIITMESPNKVVLGSIYAVTHTIENDDFAPEVKNSIADTTILEDSYPDDDPNIDPLSIPIMNVFDKKGNVVTYSVALLDSANSSINAVISGATGNESVHITTKTDLNGSNTVVITALAVNGLLASDTFNVVVTPVNDLPTIRPNEAVQTIRLIVSADEKDNVPLQRIWVEDIETAAASLTVTVVSSGDEIALPVDSIWILNVAGENNMRDIKIKPVQNSADTFNVVIQVDDGTDVVQMIMVVEITGEFRITKYIGADHNEDENFVIVNTDLSYINIPSGFTIADIVLGFPTPDALANYTLKGDSIVPQKDFNGFLTVTVEATVNGVTTQGDVDIKLLNTNDAPYDVGIVDNNFNENVSVCQELTAKDDDGDDVTFEVVDDVRFEVKNGNQLCSVEGALDYEALTIGTVSVIATDGIDTVTAEISFDVVDEIEYSTGQIESITNITIQKYMNVAQDSALVLTNQSSITVEYSVEGVDGTIIQEIILGPNGLNGINTYEIYAQNPTKNNPDTLKVTVVHNSIGPTVIVTDDDIMLQAVDGDTLNRLIHSITKEIQGTAFFDGSSIDTVYTFNKRLVLDKYIALLDEDLKQSTIASYVSLDDYTLIQGTINTITDSVVDVFGNVTTYTFYVVYDTIPPTIAIVSPADGIKTSLSLIEVVWTISDDAKFIEKVDSEDLTIGDWPISRDYMDLAGNVGADSIGISVILAEIGGDLELKEDLITVTPNERGNVYGDAEYVSGVYIVKQAKDVDQVTSYNAVYGDHVAGEQKVANGLADGAFDVDEMQDRLTYDKKRGPEVIVTMNLKPIYPFDSDNRPMTFLPAQWSNHVTGEVVMYDMVGQYLSTYKFDVPVDDPEYFTEDGEVILRFKIFMRGDGENIVLRTRGDRQLGSGVYLLMARFIGTSIPLIPESGLKPEKFVTNKVMRFGYSRPESGLVIRPVE